MNAARKIDRLPPAPVPRPAPTILSPDDVAALASPAHALHARLLDVYATPHVASTGKLPVVQRLAVIGGLSVALWAMIGGALFVLSR